MGCEGVKFWLINREVTGSYLRGRGKDSSRATWATVRRKSRESILASGQQNEGVKRQNIG